MPDVISGQFEWDSEKNKANQEKHGIAFEDAKNVFDEPYLKLRAQITARHVGSRSDAPTAA